MTSETVQTMCLVTTVTATLHFVSLDWIVVVVPLQGCKVEPYPRRSFILYMKIGSSSSSDSDSDNGEDRQDDQTLTAQFEDIIQQLKNMIYILDLQHCTVYLTDFWRWKLVVIAWWCWVPNWSLMRPAILPNAACQSVAYLMVASSTTGRSQDHSRGDAMQQACGYKLALLGSWKQ